MRIWDCNEDEGSKVGVGRVCVMKNSFVDGVGSVEGENGDYED